MVVLVQHIKSGIRKGFNISGKIVVYTFPFYIFIDWLKYSGFLSVIGDFFKPITHLMGLPGEATIVLLSGFLINLYPAIASMVALNLTVKQITIIGIVLGIAHNLIIEGIVLSKSGVKIYITILFRLFLAIITGVGVNLIWNFLS